MYLFHYIGEILYYPSNYAGKKYWPFYKIFAYSHGHNILELYNVLIQTRLTTSKTKRDI